MSKAISTRFLEAVEKYLLGLGARKVGDGERGKVSFGYKYVLETSVAGTLLVGPFAQKGRSFGIFCRFQDAAQANALFGNTSGRLAWGKPNPYTGKWNLHLNPKGQKMEMLEAAVRRHIPQEWSQG